jgi:hypothetical protein
VPGVTSAWESGAVTVAVRRYSDLSGVAHDHVIDTFEGLSVEAIEEMQWEGALRRLSSSAAESAP